MAYDGSSEAVLANWDEALKDYYLPAIQDYMGQSKILSSIIETNEKDVSGRKALIQCKVGGSTGFGARGDGEALPDASYQKFKTNEVKMKYNYGRVAFSGPTIRATRDLQGSYAKVVETEIEGIVEDVAKDINRQMWGAGYGVLGRWRSGTADPYTLQKRYYSNSAGGDGFGSTFGAKYLKNYNTANVVTLSFASSNAGCTAATVDDTKMTIPLTGAIDTSGAYYDTLGTTHTDPAPSPGEAAGTFLIRVGNMASLTSSSIAGAGRKEMVGIRGIVTDTNLDDISFTDGPSAGVGFAASSAPAEDPLQGLSVDSYSWFKAKVDSHSSGRYLGQRSLSLNLMQKMFDNIEDATADGSPPEIILTTKAIRREYIDLMSTQKRFVDTMDIDGGWKGISYNGVFFGTDIDAIDGEMYFLTPSDLQLYRMSDYEWMREDGSVLSRVSGYDAYEAVFFRYAELGVNNRATQGVITDLDYTL